MVRRIRRGRSFASIVVLSLLAFAPVAFAQTTTPPPKHKKKKPATTETAPAASSSAPADAPAPSEPAPAAAAETPPAPAEPAEAPPPKKTADVPNNPPDETAWDISDTAEDPNKSYMFIGVRYRGTIIPQFLENLFVNDGATVYSNSVGVEFDLRKNGGSTIPWISYADYNTGDILFFQKGQNNTGPFHSVVNSSLKAIYIGVDELWSTPIVKNKLDFEYGFGVGIGFLFGHLVNNWVYDSGNTGPLVGDGHHYTPCATVNQGPSTDGCNPANHSDPNPPHVGGHVEPNWFGGGSVPVIFPHIAVPQLSLRYKPIKQLETRFSLGFSLTGFWFGLSADYGLEQRPQAAHKSGLRTSLGDTL